MRRHASKNVASGRVRGSRIVWTTVTMLILGFGTESWAGFFLNVPGIPGEATFPPAAGQIEAVTFSWGIDHGTKATACGREGKLSFSAVCVIKHTDIASPKLLVASAQGTVFPTVMLSLYKASDLTPYSQWTLTNAIVSSVQTGQAIDQDRPTETVCFNFAKVVQAVTPQNGAGGPPVIAGWDVCGRSPL